MKSLLKSLVLLSIVIYLPRAAAGNTGTIARVHNGGLIELHGGFTARLTGLEVPDKDTKTGYLIYDFVKRKIEGRIVKIFTYTTNNLASGIVYDEDGYAFVQIVYGDEMNSRDWSINLNALLLEKGFARVDAKYLPEDLHYFMELEQKAREQKLGIWAGK